MEDNCKKAGERSYNKQVSKFASGDNILSDIEEDRDRMIKLLFYIRWLEKASLIR
jgi:hypothetical protein